MEDTLAIDAYKMELERVKYLLKSYFRIRLAKIENQLFYLIKEWQTVSPNLSLEEQKYAMTMCALRGRFFKENFYRMLPSFCRDFEADKPLPPEMCKPPADSYVFIRVVQSAGVCQFAGEYTIFFLCFWVCGKVGSV